jgi:hypothetical protein
MAMTGRLDPRFSEASEPVSWREVSDALTTAELYWLTTVRGDGRPHITPLVGIWTDDSFVFCTGPDEQKARNLAASTKVAVTTGVNTWSAGLDVIVEGHAKRVTGRDALTRLADAVREKYHGDWDFTPTDNGFGHTDDSGDSHIAYVYRVRPAKMLAFAKAPHGQTTFRF